MHEFGLCESILDAVERRAKGRLVRRVTVRIGALHRVSWPALETAFSMVSTGTVADGAEIEMVAVAVRYRCRECDAETADREVVVACSQCDGSDLELLAGDELVLESLTYDASSGTRAPSGQAGAQQDRTEPDWAG